jgi:hypothetical protein
MGQNVVEGFQGLGNHGRKKGTLSLYDIYGTHWGGCDAQIDPINHAQVFCSCYLIARKVMKKHTKNESTLDAITVVEFTKNGAPLNLC